MSSRKSDATPRGAGESFPVALTPILGRTREVEEAERLLTQTRLLTITGAGGSGKTRLALELAARAASRHPDGVVWVDLAPINEPGFVAQQLLKSLALRELPAVDVVEFAAEQLRDFDMLLVLDNCEHLIAESATVAETILRGCPAISILTTTREPLGITGEQAWLVPPLAENDAVQLFVERARAVAPSFTLTTEREPIVRRICQRLDGIPLAIELAAARVKVLTPEQIAARLNDAFQVLSSGSRTLPRHRTIRETIDWSFRLLDVDEQTLLRRLSVFPGSFSLTSAETICGAGGLEVLVLLAQLVDKSLVMSIAGEQMRYRLLETVRQFAAEKLDQSGERAIVREKHALHFALLIDKAEPRLFSGAVDLPTMAMLDLEIGNVRAVFDWAEEDASRSEIELRLLWAMHWYWFARGHFHEARRRISEGLARATGGIDPIVLARARVAAGNAAMWQGDWEALRAPIEPAIETLRGSTNLRALANALTILGAGFAFAENDAERARATFEEAKNAARSNGRTVALAFTLYWDGLAARLRDDDTAARASFEEARGIANQLQNRPAIGHSNTVIGHLSLSEKKYDEAMQCFRDALEVHAAIDDRWGLAQVVEGIGLTLLETGDPESGTRLYAAASAAWLHLGAKAGRRDDASLETDRRIRRMLTDNKLRTAFASGAAMTHEDVLALARQKTVIPNVSGESVSGILSDSSLPMLRIRALGPLEIYRGDDLVDGVSQAARSRELLLFLLTNPSGATKEQIGAALWPDIDAGRLRNNFHVTMHRLRKTLGRPEWIVADGETYAIDRKAVLDFDADTFEQTAREAVRSEDAEKLARAVEIYRGDFFASATAGEWHLEIRDRLRDLYASTLGALGRARMSAGNFSAAAEVYQQLFAFDPLDEQACRNLMRCLAQKGDSAAASRAYRRLVEALRRELDAEPDPATTSLHARLRASPRTED